MRSFRLSLPILFAVFLLAVAPPGAQAAPKVVVSIKPLHSLVAAVMVGVGEPTLLLSGAGSPHSYSLKPSEARALAQSDLVFWIGDELEQFLVKTLGTLSGSARVVALTEAEGIAFLDVREGGVWGEHDHGSHEEAGEHEDDHEEHGHEGHGHEEHGHEEHDHEERADHEEQDHAEHGHEGHDHGERDIHIWLDPDNAAAMVRAIMANLSHADPANAERYTANGTALLGLLDGLDSEIKALLSSVKDHPYIVFHDAYQYFEVRYGTNGVGAISVSPERAPGAKRLAALRDEIVDRGAVCVFSEPQFEPALVATIAEGTAAKTGELDPLGADLSPGPGAYFALMRNLAKGFHDCLTPSS